MSGRALPRKGEIWWVLADKRRPVVVVQSDAVLEPRVRTFLVVPLTTRLHLEGLPGTVAVSRRASRLPKTSVANVYDVQKVILDDFLEPVARLPGETVAGIDRGLRLVLGL